MYFKQLVLLALSGFIMLIFVNLGPNKTWFERRIYSFGELYNYEMEYNTEEGRREFRWGEPYFTMRGIKDYIEAQKKEVKDVVVLLPTQEYCDKNGVRFAMPEPVICYYFAGLRTTRINCDDVYEADYCLIANKGSMHVQPLENKDQINMAIQLYNGSN